MKQYNSKNKTGSLIRKNNDFLKNSLKKYIIETKNISKNIPVQDKKQYFQDAINLVYETVDSSIGKKYDTSPIMGTSKIGVHNQITIPKNILQYMDTKSRDIIVYAKKRGKIFLMYKF